MNVEEKINECTFNLKQINHFEPDPYYVNYFFNLFIKSANQVYDGIFEEANNDFGLFVSGECNKEKFYKKALIKKDENAIEFVDWFEKKIETEHQTSYPNFIKYVMEFQKEFHILPKIKIMMRTKNKYPGDITQEIKVNLTNQKLRSKEEMWIEIKRNLPIYLEMINRKRSSCNEPKVTEKQITVSTFMEDKFNESFEIAYASEVYIPVLKRFLKESREKIKKIIY